MKFAWGSAVAVAALVIGLVAAPGSVQTAEAANTASVSGKVTAEVGGANLAGVQVTLYSAFTGVAGTATTAANGTYSITGLAPSSYTLYFNTLGTINYVSEWYSGQPTQDVADFFEVLEGQAATNRNATLVVGATVSGNVKGAPSTNLAGVAVTVFDAFEQTFGAATTDASGNYTVLGLPGGTYTLRFTTALNYIDEFYNDQPFFYLADYFDVATSGATTGRNAVLAAGASISGRVTAGANVAVQNSPITFYSSVGDLVGEVSTNASGNYTINGLAGGEYTAVFGRGSISYAVEWWENQPTLSTATFIEAPTAAVVTGKDVYLDAAATISGSVLTERGEAFNGSVHLYLANGGGANGASYVKTVSTNGSGNYMLTGLPVGSYRIGYTSYAPDGMIDGTLPATTGGYLSQWYSNKFSYAASSVVQITVPGSVLSADVVMVHPEFADAADPNSAFFTSIQWMYNSGISQGTAQGGGLQPLYNATGIVSRQAMASFLFKLSGESYTPPAVASFADVPVGSTFFKPIEWMKFKGISVGTGQPSGLPLFKPADVVSRQSMALFLARYAGVNVTTPPSVQSFEDVPTNASAAAAIKWMKDTGISTGTAQPSGLPLFKPADGVSRQAMAAFLFRLAHL